MNKVYAPKCCDNETCNKPFYKGDKAIMHDDIHAKWFFCCEECYVKWLDEYKVRIDIIVGEEIIEEKEDEDEIL